MLFGIVQIGRGHQVSRDELEVGFGYGLFGKTDAIARFAQRLACIRRLVIVYVEYLVRIVQSVAHFFDHLNRSPLAHVFDERVPFAPNHFRVFFERDHLRGDDEKKKRF